MPHLWLRVAVLFYGGALLYALAALLARKTVARRVILPIVGTAGIFHLVSVLETVIAADHFGVAVTYQYQSVLALLLMGVFFVVLWRYQTTSHGIFVFPVVFLLTTTAALEHGAPELFSPVLRSGWTYTHIVLIFLGYAGLFFAFASSLLYLVQERSLKSKSVGGWIGLLPPLATMDDIGLRSLLLGFPFMTLGLIAGSVLAQERFGAVYFRDPKIVLSILMWLVYMFLLFMRWMSGWRGRRAAVLSSLAFLSATLAWAANYVSSVHRFVER
jgi:ABC-type uncharacterized transport system permease subunit